MANLPEKDSNSNKRQKQSPGIELIFPLVFNNLKPATLYVWTVIHQEVTHC